MRGALVAGCAGLVVQDANSRVEEEGVDDGDFVDHFGGESLDRGIVVHVEFHDFDGGVVDMALDEGIGEEGGLALLAFGCVTDGEDKVGSFHGEELAGGFEAEACAGSGDDDGFVGEVDVCGKGGNFRLDERHGEDVVFPNWLPRKQVEMGQQD